MIYFDNAATTRPLPCAMAEYEKVTRETPFNPSSEHQAGQLARDNLEDARERIARCISAPPESIFFTSGATESCQWAMQTLFDQCASVFISAVEHHAVSERKHVRDSTILPHFQSGCAMMLGQNEVGTIFDVKELHEKYNLVFTDATAVVGHIPVDVDGVDLMAFSGHKFGGVPGAGVLYVKDTSILYPLIRGGGQERGMRSGTENVPAICAMAAALEWQTEHMQENTLMIGAVRSILLKMLSEIPRHKWNTPTQTPCLPHILNISFDGVDAHALALLLSNQGVMVSPGAACSNGRNEPSHVIMAMYHDEARARSAIRISFSHENTIDEAVEAGQKIKEAVAYLRSIS